jgi:xanthine dehydrogenase accessory factor
MSESLLNLLRRAADLQRRGQRAAACLLVKARGSTPQAAGALMLVDEDANTYGTVGGGCVEAEVRRQAHAMLAEHRSGLLRFKLDHDYGWDDGLICGGTIEMAVGALPDVKTLNEIIDRVESRTPASFEVNVQATEGPLTFSLDLPPRDRLYIAGAGHVGQALARLALRLDFEVTLFDDRSDLVAKFAPEGCHTMDGDIAARLREAEFDERTYAVVVTRGHRHDEQALHAVLNRGAAYIGMIGSRRKVKLIFDDLEKLGMWRTELDKVHAPIGLDIGSITVEEIAISIAAQLVQVRRASSAAPVRGPSPLGAASVVPCAVSRGG